MPTYVKATTEQESSLALKMYKDGFTAEAVLEQLKSQGYRVANTSYNASRVASMVGVLRRVDAGLKTGTIKATKAKGLQWK